MRCGRALSVLEENAKMKNVCKVDLQKIKANKRNSNGVSQFQTSYLINSVKENVTQNT
jgi:hypothetical protein